MFLIQDLNYRDAFGTTAIMYACFKNDENMVKYLLDKKADPNLVDDEGRGVLVYASYGCAMEVDLVAQAAQLSVIGHGLPHG